MLLDDRDVPRRDDDLFARLGLKNAPPPNEATAAGRGDID
jgi:hypothetical protein